MPLGCVQNVLFTNDEWATSQLSSTKLFKNFKQNICENYFAKTTIHRSGGEY